MADEPVIPISPIVEVEGESWTGLMVVQDERWVNKSPGRYGLVQASEWKYTGDPKDPDREVTVWKGPEKPDEKIKRRDLGDVECRTVLVDKDGFYTCAPSMPEGFRRLVMELGEPLLNEEANERAAEAASYIHDGYEDDFGDDVWIIARYGDAVAVNGDSTASRKRQYPPKNWVETDQGGRDPMGMEEEIDVERLVEMLVLQISDKVGYEVDPGLILAAVTEEYKPRYGYIPWNSSSGDTEIWTSKKGLKAYEKRKQESLDAARERREREIREAREKEKEERRRKMREGGFPGPKDWSPTGGID